jgi:hypothetical protein
MYIYFAAFAVAYFLLTFIRSGGSDAGQLLGDAESFFTVLPAVVGGYFFAALYTDDLNAKNLGTLIGFGIGKAKIVLAKLILMALFSALILLLLPLFMFASYAVMGVVASTDILGSVYIWVLKSLLQIVAFSSVAAIVVYGLQRATFGMVSYLLLALGIVSQLLGMLLDWELISSLLPGLSSHLMAGISLRLVFGILTGGPVLLPVVEFAIYTAIATALAVLAFHKKELEF